MSKEERRHANRRQTEQARHRCAHPLRGQINSRIDLEESVRESKCDSSNDDCSLSACYASPWFQRDETEGG